MAAENSFDIACKVDMQEVANAVNQAKREVETRYDLKGSKNEIAEEKMDLVLTSADDMKLKAVLDILQSKLHRRGVDLKALTVRIPRRRRGGRCASASPSRTAFPWRRPRRSCASSRTPRSGCKPPSRKSRCASRARTATISRPSLPSSNRRIWASPFSSPTIARTSRRLKKGPSAGVRRGRRHPLNV